MICYFIAAAVVLISVTVQGQSCVSNSSRVEFLFMSSFGEAFVSGGSVIGVEMAIERINSNNSLLSNHTLYFNGVVDSQCERSVSLSSFIRSINQPCPGFIAVIGSGCSVATEPAAELSHFWGLSQISYGSSAANLKNRRRFPNYFQLYPSEVDYIPSVAATVDFFDWKRVAVVTQNENLFTQSLPILQQLLEDRNISLMESTPFDSVINPAFDPDFFQFAGDTHIFFMNSYEDKARQVACAAYENNLYGPYFTWIFFGWYDSHWWAENDTNINCTAEEMTIFVNNSLTIQQYPINEMTDKVVIGNYSYNSFFTEYESRISSSPYQSTYVAHIAYDAVWTFALALDKVITRLSTGNVGNCNKSVVNSLEDFDYKNDGDISCLLKNELSKTNFEGLTGKVEFDMDGTRLSTSSPIRIYQIHNNNTRQIARSTNNIVTFINGFDFTNVFPSGVPPDGTPDKIISHFHTALIVLLYVLSSAGLVLCLICLIFTLIFRNKRIIRLTSPNLNYFIIGGTALVYASIFLRVYPMPTTNDEHIISVIRTTFCSISIALDFIGYTIAFSAILSKIWRIYYIFHNPSPKKKTVTDYHLIAIICCINVGMIGLLAIGFAVSELRPTANKIIDTETPIQQNERRVNQEFFIYECFTYDFYIIWLCLLYVYIGILQIVALILAIQTRKVRIKILNDSKEVAAIIYITSIILIGLVIVSLSLSDFLNLQETLYSSGLIVTSTVILMIIFIPKMVRLCKDPNATDESNVFSTVDIDKKGGITIQTDKDRIAQLETQLCQLRLQLESSLKGPESSSDELRRTSEVRFSDVLKIHDDQVHPADDISNPTIKIEIINTSQQHNDSLSPDDVITK